uniref:Uncharacterized protein n=1 Tax=Vespula pensylvanica TaxID=30213 RepID=A0A834U8L9_VESPE|nr:hypothetical protein H0235_009819 [Vespula pensylvanica]
MALFAEKLYGGMAFLFLSDAVKLYVFVETRRIVELIGGRLLLRHYGLVLLRKHPPHPPPHLLILLAIATWIKEDLSNAIHSPDSFTVKPTDDSVMGYNVIAAVNIKTSI